MILVTGVNGQLGHDVIKELIKRGIPCKGIDISDLDITNQEDTLNCITQLKPSAVIHCAAYTAVDKAEDDVTVCTAVNVDGTRNIALACERVDAKMMYISTDYVFPGTGDAAYEVDDAVGPLSVYGQTKLQGEVQAQQITDKLFIVRVSWVFGINGNNFVKTMIRLGKEKSELNVVNDQIGSPTYTADLAVLLCNMITTDKYGIYHATNEGYCSWAEFAQLIMQRLNLPCIIKAIPTIDYKTRAIRPLNSKMSKASLDANGFARLPAWQDALDRYIKEIKQ